MANVPPWAQNSDDLMLVPDRVLAIAIPAIDPYVIAMCLKACPAELKDRILGFLDSKMAQAVVEEMEFLGPVLLADIESAQQKVVDAVNKQP